MTNQTEFVSMSKADVRRLELLDANLRLRTYKRQGSKGTFYAARIHGLTAYRDTVDAAVDRLKFMLTTQVEFYWRDIKASGIEVTNDD